MVVGRQEARWEHASPQVSRLFDSDCDPDTDADTDPDVVGAQETRQVQWSQDSRRFLLVTDRGAWSGEQGRDTLERFPVTGDFPCGLGLVQWFDGQAALLVDRRGSTLHRVTSDGTVTRLLPAAR